MLVLILLSTVSISRILATGLKLFLLFLFSLFLVVSISRILATGLKHLIGKPQEPHPRSVSISRILATGLKLNGADESIMGMESFN